LPIAPSAAARSFCAVSPNESNVEACSFNTGCWTGHHCHFLTVETAFFDSRKQAPSCHPCHRMASPGRSNQNVFLVDIVLRDSRMGTVHAYTHH
jgi:hypothetical protein